MPRIPDEVIEKIKAEVSLLALAERSGVELKRMGKELMGRCPFGHEDKTPSISINEERNVFQCFACGAAGSAIDWTMRENGIDFRQAVEVLLREFFPDLVAQLLGDGSRRSRRFRAEPLPCPLDEDADDAELDRQVVAYYHATLEKSPEALAYLEKRGITAETIARFQLGFANRTLGLGLTAKLKERLQARGWFRKETGHEHHRGGVAVPIFGASGEVLNCYSRKIRDDLRPGTPKHLYLPGPRRGVLNLEAFAASEEILLCEAPLDFLGAWGVGHRASTCTWGAGGFTDDHLAAFVSHGVARCYIAFDRDEAGDEGAASVAKKLGAAGVECFRVLLPKGMDVNDVVRTMHPAGKTLDVFIRNAEWMGNGHRPSGPRAGGAPPERAARASEPPLSAAGAASATSAGEAPASSSRPSEVSASADEAAEKENARAAEEEISSEPAPQTASSGSVDRFAQTETPSDAAARNVEASAVSPSPSPASPVELNGDDEALFRFEDRSYRVQGLKKALTRGSLHVTVHAQREGDYFAPPSPITGWFLDRFDFVSALARTRFEKSAAHEMAVKPELVKWDLGQVLRQLEQMQRRVIEEALKPKATAPPMTDEERADGLDYGSAPELIERILRDYEASGVVGETTNKLMGYIGGVSRLAEKPLAIIIRSSSAAGKTALMDAILRFLPKESHEKYSALTENSLFYFEGKDFKHKVLAIVEEEGAQRASYALKLLQSEGVITIASTGKDPGTGRLVTKEYRVEGPVMIFLASTSVEIAEELLNRAIVLTIDEGREQTRAIHRLQREAQTLEGLWAKEEREEIYRRHHAFQRLLRPLHFVNPFVRELTFLDDTTRTRRDHTKYLGIIEAVTLLHQFQRPLKTETKNGKTKEYIEATLFDVALANRLAAEVIGRTLDELGPQTRRLLMLIDEMVSETSTRYGIARSDLRFSRRDVRLYTGWSDTQLRVHLGRLQELEYLLVHGGRNGQRFVYELLYDGQGKDGTPFLIGLADVETLAKAHGLPVPALPGSLEPLPRREPEAKGDGEDGGTTQTSRGFEGTSRGQNGPLTATLRGGRQVPQPAPHAASSPISAETAETAHLEASPGSYPEARRSRTPQLNLLRFPPEPKGTPRPRLLPRRVREGS